ncbi:MAG: hypothetical protein SWE60_18190, partial [Thermodesulfobacteriota bacterium]|nr:hypothetical protein [Thermodesulfobacteriota bacterium]
MPITTRFLSVVRLCVALAALFMSGCVLKGTVAGPGTEEGHEIDTVVVMPFEAVALPHDVGASVRCPLCGAIFQGGPIRKGGHRFMTGELTQWVKETTSFTLVPSGAAQGVRSGLLAEEIGMSELRLIVET